ncbi:MAG: hypothetical protein ACFWTQ_07645 [Lactococcus sp.]
MIKLDKKGKLGLSLELILFIVINYVSMNFLLKDQFIKLLGNTLQDGIFGAVVILQIIFTLISILFSAVLAKIILYLLFKVRISFALNLYMIFFGYIIVQILFILLQYCLKQTFTNLGFAIIQSAVRNSIYGGILYKKEILDKNKVAILITSLFVIDILFVLFSKILG